MLCAVFRTPARAADLFVDLTNDGAEAVSVPAGTDNGITGESDFSVVVSDNLVVPIYPAEIFQDRFWSQPLATELYRSVRPGMRVRAATFSKVVHQTIRAEGEDRLADLKARAEEARRETSRRQAEDLREKRNTLLDRRDALDERIAAKEGELADEEGRVQISVDMADDDIDRASQRIADFADRRDELQSQRAALAQQSRSGQVDTTRLASEIKILSGQINTERERIRLARERKRSARTGYLVRKQEWQKMVADRNALGIEIKSLDLRIKELMAR